MSGELNDHEIKTLMFDRFASLWRPPKKFSDGTMVEYGRALKHLRPVELEATVDYLATHHTKQHWPTIPEVLKAVKDAAPAKDPPRSPRAKEADHSDKIEMLMHSPQGQMALTEGWGRAFVEFVTKHGRVPQSNEASLLFAQHRQAKADAAGLNPNSTLTPTLRKMWANMQAREEELRRKYLAKPEQAADPPSEQPAKSTDPFDMAIGS